MTASVVVRDRILTNSIFVGDDLQLQHGASLETPAAVTGHLTFTSSDPSRLLLASAPDQAGSASVTVEVEAGQTGASIWFQALANSGNASFTVTAEGYRTATSSVTFLASGFGCFRGLGVLPCTATTTDSLTPVIRRIVPVALLGGSPRPEFGRRIRGGLTVEVEIANSDPGVLSSPTTFTFANGGPQGLPDSEVTFEPLAGGEATLTFVPPPGFEEPDLGSQLLVTVVEPTFNFSPASLNIGRDLQSPLTVVLTTSPSAPLELTLAVSDPSVAVVSTEANQMGSGSVTLSGVTGRSVPVYLQGLELGTTTLTVSAPGFGDAALDFDVLPAAISLSGDLTINTLDGPGQIYYQTQVEDPDPTRSNVLLRRQAVRAGASVSFQLTNSDPLVGELPPGPFLVPTGVLLPPPIPFTQMTAGVSTVGLVQPTGFVDPTGDGAFSSITVTVEQPRIVSDVANNLPLLVGSGLEVIQEFELDELVSPVEVTVTSQDPSVALVAPFSTPGAASTSITLSGSHRDDDFSVQGVSEGTTTVTLSAPGYESAIVDVTVAPAGLRFQPTSGLGTAGTALALELTTFDPVRLLPLASYTCLPDVSLPTGLRCRAGQRLRPGHPALSLEVTSSNTTVAAITNSPVEFAFPAFGVTVGVDPIVAGSTVLEIVPPPGFARPDFDGVDRSRIDLTVRAPDIGFSAAALDVGLNLQHFVDVVLEEAPPEPVSVTLTSTAPSIATLTTDPTAEGGDSVTFTGVTGTSVGRVWIQGRVLGSAEVVAQAAGYDDGALGFEVVPSGFAHENNGPLTTTAGATTLSARVVTSPLQLVRGGLTIDVVVTSGQPDVAALVDVPLTFSGGEAVATYGIDPIAPGVSVLTVEPPSGFVAPSVRQQLTVAVDP